MDRFKTYDATGIAPNGRLYAGDMNMLQDLVAALTNFAQIISASSFKVGDSSLAISKFGAGEFLLSGSLRTSSTGIIRGLGGLFAGTYTTTQRNAISNPPFGLIILNTTTVQLEWNAGTPAVPSWQPISSGIADRSIAAIKLVVDSITANEIAPNAIGASELADNAVDNAALATDSVDARVIAADTITAAEIAPNAVGASELGADSVGPSELVTMYDAGIGVSFAGNVHVNFAVPFTVAPVVVPGMMVGNPGANGGAGEPPNYTTWVDNITAGSFDLYHNQGGTRTVAWHAIGG